MFQRKQFRLKPVTGEHVLDALQEFPLQIMVDAQNQLGCYARHPTGLEDPCHFPHALFGSFLRTEVLNGRVAVHDVEAVILEGEVGAVHLNPCEAVPVIWERRMVFDLFQ